MKITADTITDEQIRELRERSYVLHPADDGARDDAWVCAKCGQPCGYRRKRPLYGYDMADAHCFTENCIGGSFCAREAFRQRIEAGKGFDDADRLNRNATIQLATRALAGEPFARARCAEILEARRKEGK